MKKFFSCLWIYFEYFLFILGIAIWIISFVWMHFFIIPFVFKIYFMNVLCTLVDSAITICLLRSLCLAFWKTSYLSGQISNDSKDKNACKKCKQLRPDPQTHHCSTCNKCVIGLDHHCVCLARCIGITNYVYFISYVFLGFVTALKFAILCGCYLYQIIFVNTRLLEAVFPLFLWCLSVSSLFGLGMLILFHLRLLANNIRTCEYWFKSEEERKKCHHSFSRAISTFTKLTESPLFESLFWPVSLNKY